MANVGDRSVGTSSSQVTLAAPGEGRKWYLQNVTVDVTANCNFTVQSPASTNKFKIALFSGMGYEKAWTSKGLPGGENEAMVLAVSTGTYNINYDAVVR